MWALKRNRLQIYAHFSLRPFWKHWAQDKQRLAETLFEAENINFKGLYWRLEVSQSCYTKNLIYYMTNAHYVELWTRFLEVYLLFSYTKKD